MTGLQTCPACNTSLRLFTPRDSVRHINDCLDSAGDSNEPAQSLPSPECGVCGRNLTALTEAARHEHANSCADSLLPTRPARAPRVRRATRSRRSGAAAGPVTGVAAAPITAAPPDPKLRALLDALGLARYAERFECEEIDLDALRLLRDEDLIALRVPEAARRRIAEALHSVEILRRITDGPAVPSPPRQPAKLTQQFPESRLATRRNDAPALDDEADDIAFDYLYTPGAASTPSQSPFRSDVRKLDLADGDTSPVRADSVVRDLSADAVEESQRTRSEPVNTDTTLRKRTVVLCDDDDDDFEDLYQTDSLRPVVKKPSVRSQSRDNAKTDGKLVRDATLSNVTRNEHQREQNNTLVCDPANSVRPPPSYAFKSFGHENSGEESLMRLDPTDPPLSPAPLSHVLEHSEYESRGCLENASAPVIRHSSDTDVMECASKVDNISSHTDTNEVSNQIVTVAEKSMLMQSDAEADIDKRNSSNNSTPNKAACDEIDKTLSKECSPNAQQKTPTEPNSSPGNSDGNETSMCMVCKGTEDTAPTPPGTLLELESWRVRAAEVEIQRHKRKMESIDVEYRRLRRKLEQMDYQNEKPAEVTIPTRVTMSPIDLTLDDTPAKALIGRSAPSAASCDIRKQTTVTNSSSMGAPALSGKWRSKIIDDDDSSSSSSSSSDDDFAASFSDRVGLRLKKDGDRSKTGFNDKRDPKDSANASLSHARMHSEQESRDHRDAGAAMHVDEPDKSGKDRIAVDVNEDDDDDDEIMDLTQRAPEPLSRPMLADVNSRESVTVTHVAPTASAPPVVTNEKAKSSKAARNKSRLRKPKQCTYADLRAAVRADPKLLDDILQLKCVEIDRVMASVKSFGLKVSQKGLETFMHAEGLGFKASAGVNEKGSTQRYFVSLTRAELVHS